VEFDVDPVTGALSFPITAGHDYRLTGGGSAEHTVPVDTELPDRVTGLSHDDADGLTALRWNAADGARAYVVSVSGHGACPSDEEVVLGATTGAVELTLGATEFAGGTYRVQAINNVGTGPHSERYTVDPPPDDGGSGVVTVTNEGDPSTCDPDRPAYAETGTWARSAESGFDGTPSRFTRTGGDTATWTTDLTTQTYDVSVWFPRVTNSAAEVTYTVHHADGETDVPVPQADTGGAWLSLGDFAFTDTEPASVTLTAGDTGVSRADAVRFSPSP